MKILADTHILLWWLEGKRKLSLPVRKALSNISADQPLLVSDISLWEIAMLLCLQRIELDRPVREWLEELIAPPYVESVKITPAIAAQVAALPDSFHRDPADRIIVASALVLGATLLTTDQRIIKSKLVKVIS